MATLTKEERWQRFRQSYFEYDNLGLALDVSRMQMDDAFFIRVEPLISRAFADMAELEKGAIANTDENRMVGHYWLRHQELAPTTAMRDDIRHTLAAVKAFADDVHTGKIRGTRKAFENLLVIGIGGSALGPQLLAHALGESHRDKMRTFFFDNTDPDGMDRVFNTIGRNADSTLTLVISKSGRTKETRNGMSEAEAFYRRASVDFAPHAVAITGIGSELDEYAKKQRWLRAFPMWDWVGGRTSVTSVVGLLPAALQGLAIFDFLAGAAECDKMTRLPDRKRNAAMILALAWYEATNGKGSRDMVVLPYKDRLELFSRYLQQLVMESLGKEKDRSGLPVHQGLTVFGNKGSTDQHAYIQQLRDGLDNFFVTFIEVYEDRLGESMMVEEGATTGDYLHGFLWGTRAALAEKGRASITIALRQINPFSLGILIALYERAVGFYASLINVNAYHQPGVEAGKIAASDFLNVQAKVLEVLQSNQGHPLTPAQIAIEVGEQVEFESVFWICEHLAANVGRGIRKQTGASAVEALYEKV